MIIVIPARGGSKRVPYKNIYPLRGKPLLSHTLETIAEARLDVPCYVTTDDNRVAQVANVYSGVKVLMRPKELSCDNSPTEDALLHLLDYLANTGEFPEWVMTLPPTSPFRSANTIRSFLGLVVDCPSNIDCFMSVTKNHSDFWLKESQGTMRRLFPNAARRQQDRTPMFEENSAVYLTRVQALRKTRLILGNKVVGVEIPEIEGFDINTLEDISMAEHLFNYARNGG